MVQAALAICLLSLLVPTSDVQAQDLEPRAFSASPIDMNFLIAGYTRTTGGLAFDSSLPITGVEAKLNTVVLGYERTFDLLGRTASAAIVLPYDQGEISGQLLGQGKEVSRSGLGDLKMRFAVNLIGGPALTPAEFAHRRPITTLGANLVVVAPTGNYDPMHLINIGSNRWAFKPEIGLSQPLGRWFAEASAGAWFFADNDDFLQGHVRSEELVEVFEAHAGYNFAPGFWLAADGTYYMGGTTSIDGVGNNYRESVSRVGLTLSVPFYDGFSAKLAGATWLSAHNGGTFDTIALTFQYRWF